jgi:predicted GH43/DUF377 family glycosyl hydrolase
MSVRPLAPPLVRRTEARIASDPRRVTPRLFVPGHEALIHGESRAMPVIERILAMDDGDVHRATERTLAAYSSRYRDFHAVLENNYNLVAHRLAGGPPVTRDRLLLIGAYFTSEYAFEAAALFNPSIVAHPDQTGVPAGELRFVMSLRAVGEGHVSSIEFRTGLVDAAGNLRFDPVAEVAEVGRRRTGGYDRELLRAVLAEDGEDDENTRFVWDRLPAHFGQNELDGALAELGRQRVTRRGAHDFVDKLRRAAASNYTTEFEPSTPLPQRLLWPDGPAETNGMEDARFVRFVDADVAGGDVATYYATYTAFDGSHVTPQLIETADFLTFTISQLSGPSAKNKGLALFPRKVGGRYAALSRWDRENNAISYSDDVRRWEPATTVQTPSHSWDLIQLGNCGSPIETPAGWLVLTHGVGPMREYAIGAALLELDDPAVVIGALDEPLLVADAHERVGYVPNVVYSCGSLLHGDTLVVPYGCSDSEVRVAAVSLSGLLDALLARPHAGTHISSAR